MKPSENRCFTALPPWLKVRGLYRPFSPDDLEPALKWIVVVQDGSYLACAQRMVTETRRLMGGMVAEPPLGRSIILTGTAILSSADKHSRR